MPTDRIVDLIEASVNRARLERWRSAPRVSPVQVHYSTATPKSVLDKNLTSKGI